MNFRAGDHVRILHRNVTGHHRVPGYVMGQIGVVTETLNSEAMPEIAANKSGESINVPVYRVRLKQSELWPDYSGSSHDTLEIEIYQHWLARSH